MLINRQNLIEALSRLKQGLSTDFLVPRFQCFHMHIDQIVATNGKIIVAEKFDIGLECSVSGLDFLKLLQTLKQKEVELTIVDNSLKIKCGRSKANIGLCDSTFEAVDFDQFGGGNATEDLLEALKQNSFTVCRDVTSGSLQGIHFSKIGAYGTDRYRLIRHGGIVEKLIGRTIPVDIFDAVNKFPSKNFAFTLIENTLALHTDDVIILTHLLEDDYPDLEQFIPKSEEYVTIDVSKEFSEIIERHISFQRITEDIDKEIKFVVSDKLCTVTSVLSSNKSDLVDEIDLEKYDGPDLEFFFNPLFLKDINCDTFKYYVAESKILISSSNTDYVVMTKEKD